VVAVGADRCAPAKGRADWRCRRQVVGDADSKKSIVELSAYPIEKPEGLNVIVGQAHLVKTVEDLHEALAGASPQLRFGIAFCEASGSSLIRRSGNEDDLVDLAARNGEGIGAGHSFIIFLRQGFPVNVLNAIKNVPEVCTGIRPRHHRSHRRPPARWHRDVGRRSRP